jgi:hypothetical protein
MNIYLFRGYGYGYAFCFSPGVSACSEQLPVQLRAQPHVRLLYAISYADQAVLTNPNFPNTSLSAASNSNPYALPLRDVHDNVDHYALVLGGFSNEGAGEVAFLAAVIGNSSTQYYLAISLIGATTFSRMQFWLLLIGTEAAGLI